MTRKALWFVIGLLTLGLMLSGCQGTNVGGGGDDGGGGGGGGGGNTPPDVTMTYAQFQNFVEGYKADGAKLSAIQEFLKGINNDPAYVALWLEGERPISIFNQQPMNLEVMPMTTSFATPDLGFIAKLATAGITPLGEEVDPCSGELPRGTWEAQKQDDGQWIWVKTGDRGNGDYDLVLSWPNSIGGTTRMMMDWQETTTVQGYCLTSGGWESKNFEVPTRFEFVMDNGSGTPYATVVATGLEWYPGQECGSGSPTIEKIGSFQFEGGVNYHLTTTAALDLSLPNKAQFSVNTRLEKDGRFVRADFDYSIEGEKSYADCSGGLFAPIVFQNDHVDTATVEAEQNVYGSDRVEFHGELQASLGSGGYNYTADGYAEINGKALTFFGSLDDMNNNCVPGDNLIVRFSDASKSLEEILINDLDTPTGDCQ